jgi:hypothetical protein
LAGLLVRAGVWCATGVLVVLASRTLAYVLAPPTLLSLELQRSAGGPRLVVIGAVAVALATGVAAAVVGLAALALRERIALNPRLDVSAPRLRPAQLTLRFVALWAASSLAFAYFESYLHWRAGLGWHGLHCLTGPVHRDAIPILAALSLVAVALQLAGEHLVAWLRRTLRRLLASFPWRRAGRAIPCHPHRATWPRGRVLSAFRARGPPAPSAFVAA